MISLTDTAAPCTNPSIDVLLVGLAESLGRLVAWADAHHDIEVGARAVATLAKVEDMQRVIDRQMLPGGGGQP